MVSHQGQLAIQTCKRGRGWGCWSGYTQSPIQNLSCQLVGMQTSLLQQCREGGMSSIALLCAKSQSQQWCDRGRLCVFKPTSHPTAPPRTFQHGQSPVIPIGLQDSVIPYPKAPTLTFTPNRHGELHPRMGADWVVHTSLREVKFHDRGKMP